MVVVVVVLVMVVVPVNKRRSEMRHNAVAIQLLYGNWMAGLK